MPLPPHTQQEIAAYSDRDLRCGFQAACVSYELAKTHVNFDAALHAQSYINTVLDEWNRRHPQ